MFEQQQFHGCNRAAVWVQKSKNGLFSLESHKEYRWGGGKEFTTLCCLHSFRIGTVQSQK